MDEISPLMPEAPVLTGSIPPPDPVGAPPAITIRPVSKLDTGWAHSPIEQVQDGLNPEGREEVLRFAHEKGLPVDDPIFQLMAIVRENDARRASMMEQENELAGRMEGAATSIKESVSHGPERIRQACEAVSTVAVESRDAVEKLRASQGYTEKLARWTFGILIGVAVLFGINGLFLIDLHRTIAAINANRDELVSSVTSVRQLQELTGSRIQLMSDQTAWEKEWAKLKAAWTDSPGEEQQERRIQLERDHGALSLRWKQLMEREDRLYEK